MSVEKLKQNFMHVDNINVDRKLSSPTRIKTT